MLGARRHPGSRGAGAVGSSGRTRRLSRWRDRIAEVTVNRVDWEFFDFSH